MKLIFLMEGATREDKTQRVHLVADMAMRPPGPFRDPPLMMSREVPGPTIVLVSTVCYTQHRSGRGQRMVRYQTEEAYDLIAQEYAVRHRELPERIAELEASFLGYLTPGSSILDVGCGSGRDMAWMEAQGFRTTGIDLSSGMLAQARKLVRGEVWRMDMCHLTFPDASFDGIWCCSSLLHVPQALAPDALGQMRRVLVKGGMLFLSLLEGNDERWEEEASEFAHVQRLFVHYPQAMAHTSLSQAGFVPVEQYRDHAGNHVWLNFLARAIG